ncbi:MAG: SDR family oxidoreductase [Gammaproteobacteria bacterium]|nr:SDR family oxidoreductase [Gammaproteobacteria bacterium]
MTYNNGRLAGKVAVITGGASGMGRSTVLLYLAEGAKVVVADLNQQTTDELLAFAKTQGYDEGSIIAQRTDVSSEEQVKSVIDLAVSQFGRLDIVFNNAGVGGAMAPVTDITVADWDKTFAILLRSVFLGIKHAALIMRSLGINGSIINTASTAGITAGSGPAAYSAAKRGVISLTESAAIELGADRIRVNAIAPGGIHTPLVPAASDDDMKRFMKGKQPWPDTGKGEDIAYAALYLGSDESRFCTGSTILVDGGLLAAGPSLFPHKHASGQVGFAMSSTGEPSTTRS